MICNEVIFFIKLKPVLPYYNGMILHHLFTPYICLNFPSSQEMSIHFSVKQFLNIALTLVSLYCQIMFSFYNSQSFSLCFFFFVFVLMPFFFRMILYTCFFIIWELLWERQWCDFLFYPQFGIQSFPLIGCHLKLESPVYPSI